VNDVRLTGTSYRKDVPDEIVNVSNEKRKQAVEEMDEAVSSGRLFWQAAPEGLASKEHLLDHVHYTEKGYEI
jgi:hypothetical protein